MLQKVILLSLFCVFATNALAAVPSTPEERAEFHNLCMRGASMAGTAERVARGYARQLLRMHGERVPSVAR